MKSAFTVQKMRQQLRSTFMEQPEKVKGERKIWLQFDCNHNHLISSLTSSKALSEECEQLQQSSICR